MRRKWPIRFEPDITEPIAVLDTILVEPGHARHGVGTALLDQLVKNLRALGIECLRTEVAWDEHDLNRFSRPAGLRSGPAARARAQSPKRS